MFSPAYRSGSRFAVMTLILVQTLSAHDSRDTKYGVVLNGNARDNQNAHGRRVKPRESTSRRKVAPDGRDRSRQQKKNGINQIGAYSHETYSLLGKTSLHLPDIREEILNSTFKDESRSSEKFWMTKLNRPGHKNEANNTEVSTRFGKHSTPQGTEYLIEALQHHGKIKKSTFLDISKGYDPKMIHFERMDAGLTEANHQNDIHSYHPEERLYNRTRAEVDKNNGKKQMLALLEKKHAAIVAGDRTYAARIQAEIDARNNRAIKNGSHSIDTADQTYNAVSLRGGSSRTLNFSASNGYIFSAATSRSSGNRSTICVEYVLNKNSKDWIRNLFYVNQGLTAGAQKLITHLEWLRRETIVGFQLATSKAKPLELMTLRSLNLHSQVFLDRENNQNTDIGSENTSLDDITYEGVNQNIESRRRNLLGGSKAGMTFRQGKESKRKKRRDYHYHGRASNVSHVDDSIEVVSRHTGVWNTISLCLKSNFNLSMDLAHLLQWNESNWNKTASAKVDANFRTVWSKGRWQSHLLGMHPGNARFWSDLHLLTKNTSLYNSTPPSAAVAVMITGGLRIKDESHVNKIQRALVGSNVFVITWTVFRTLAHRFTKQVLLLSESELPKSTFTSIFQWYLLKRGLEHWNDELSEPGRYSTIVRFRTDMRLPPYFRFTDCIGRMAGNGAVGVVYAFSDLLFYSTPMVFIKIFSTMYTESIEMYSLRSITGPLSSRRVEIFREIFLGFNGMSEVCLTRDEYAPDTVSTNLLPGRHATVLSNVFVEAKHALKHVTNEFANRRMNLPDILETTGLDIAVANWSSKNETLLLDTFADEEIKHHDGLKKKSKKSTEKTKNKQKKTKHSNVKLDHSKESSTTESRKAKVEIIRRMYCGCKFGISLTTIKNGAAWHRDHVGFAYQSEPAMAYHILTMNASCLPADLKQRALFELYPDRHKFKYGLDHRTNTSWDEEVEEEIDDVQDEEVVQDFMDKSDGDDGDDTNDDDDDDDADDDDADDDDADDDDAAADDDNNDDNA